MTQSSLWQDNKQNNDFAELCNALYEREITTLANTKLSNVQGRLKSLVHYVNRTAHVMMQMNEQSNSPLNLDIQNATWLAKQASKLPLKEQHEQDIRSWYLTHNIVLGLIVPVLKTEHIILDSIDRIDTNKSRIRTNVSGWFSLISTDETVDDLPSQSQMRLLKPNKKVMLAACAGHHWQNGQSKKLRPIIPSLRELLLSCAINWKDFKQPLAL